jgi:ABC-2 type transport system permease protein
MLAGYRERGILRRLETTPAGPARVLAAQLIVNLAVVVVAVILLLGVARIGYGVSLPRQLAGFAFVTLLTAVTLISIRLFIAALAPSGRSAQIIGALLFYPMMFFAGLWLPIAQMSAVLQHISHATPLGAAVQSMEDAGVGQWPHLMLLLTMAAYAVGFGLAAARLFCWE